MRRADDRVDVSHGVPPLVVGQNEEDVGALRGGGLLRLRGTCGQQPGRSRLPALYRRRALSVIGRSVEVGVSLFAAGAQEGGQFAHGAAAVRHGVLLVGRHLGEGTVAAVGHEERIVTEPLGSGLPFDDAPLDDPFEEVLLVAPQAAK